MAMVRDPYFAVAGISSLSPPLCGIQDPAGLCYFTSLNCRSLLCVCTIAASRIAFGHIGLIHQIKHR